MIRICYNFQVVEIIFQVYYKHIIVDYAGFVPGIRSENLFGKTFGKITLLTGSHTMH